MSDSHDDKIPQSLLVGAGVLIASCLLLVAYHQISNIGVEREAHPAFATVSPKLVRQLQFDNGPDGALHVFDVVQKKDLGPLQEEEGFVRAVVSGLTFERQKRGLEDPTVYQLVLWTDDRLSLEDQATGIRINLGAFGQGNKDVFNRFLAGAAPAT